MTTDNFCFYLQNRLIQTCQTGGQWYSDTSPFSIPWIVYGIGSTENRPLTDLKFKNKNIFEFFLHKSFCATTICFTSRMSNKFFCSKEIYYYLSHQAKFACLSFHQPIYQFVSPKFVFQSVSKMIF